jgi:hypothetical protein
MKEVYTYSEKFLVFTGYKFRKNKKNLNRAKIIKSYFIDQAISWSKTGPL